MKVIKRENRRFLNDDKEDGIHVVLPMLDETYLDSIFRLLDGVILWRFEPHDTYGIGDNFIRALEHSADGTPNDWGEYPAWGLHPAKEGFLSMLEKHYPEDLEFFIWHPEVFNGEYHE
jgi:hypothetical protein